MIRKKRTTTGKIRYSPRVHLGGGKYQLLGTFDAERAAKEAEAKWLLKRGGGRTQRGGEWAEFWLAGYADRVKDSSLQTATAAINCWLKTFGTRRLTTIEPTEAEEWARQHRWAVPPVVTMLNDAARKEVIERNPFAGLSQKGAGRRHITPLTAGQVEKLALIAEDTHGIGSFIRFCAYSRDANR